MSTGETILWVIAVLAGSLLVAAWHSPRIRMSVGAWLIAGGEAMLIQRRVHARRYSEILAEADKKVEKAAAVAMKQRRAIARKAAARERPREKRLAAVG